MKLKKISTLLIAGAMLVTTGSYSTTVDASTTTHIEQEIISEYTDTDSIVPTMAKNGTLLTAGVTILPKSQSISVSGRLYIERKLGSYWFAEKSWAISGTGITAVQFYYVGQANGIYRTRVSATVGADSIYATSNSVTIS